MKPISKLCLLLSLAIAFTACIPEFDPPKKRPPAEFADEQLTSIRSLKDRHRGEPVVIRDSVIISGRVISNDRSGNIYNELYIQDDDYEGIRIKIRMSNMFNFYRLGQRVYINCFGLILGNNAGTLELGTRSTDGRNETGRIEGIWTIEKTVLQGTLEDEIEPMVITFSKLNRNLVNTLVRINDLTFKPTLTDGDTIGGRDNVVRTWALPNPVDGSNPRSLSQLFEDESEQTIITRNSGYARFAGDVIPTGKVDLIGILTIFNNNYQLLLRDLNDVIIHKESDPDPEE
ncbi:MAG: DUF5689 domain-containing protein [Bacteroidales bacterium]|nr:DUF5689 domain-containing protein [Bacteroidales bacterium]